MRVRTVEESIYNYEDLLKIENKELKEKCFKNWRESVYLATEEVEKTLEKFKDMLGIEAHYNYNEFGGDINFESSFDDEILELEGIRLLKYIYNNYDNNLFKGKYFSLWSKKDISYKYYKEGYPVLKARYSKVIKENTCVLSGVCFDEDILEPIYSFIKNPKGYNFEDLINECLESWLKCAINDYSYQLSEEYFLEETENNQNEFTEDGEILN